MGTLRALLSISSIAGIVFLAGSASSGSPIEHLISGTASPQGDGLVAGDHGARYELRGGTIVDVAPGSEFSFEPSKRIPLGRRGEPDRPTRVVHLMHGSVDVTVPATKRDPTALMVRGPGKMSSVTRAGTSTFLAADDRSTAACRTGDMLVGVGNDWRPLKQGFARTDEIEITGDVTLEAARERGKSFRTGLIRVEKYFEGTHISAYAGPPPETEHTDYCWGGCPGAIEEAIEILRLFDEQCDEKMARLHVVFGAYRGPIDAAPGERVVFIGDCASWKGEINQKPIQISSKYQPRSTKDPHFAKSEDIFVKLAKVQREINNSEGVEVLRFEGCPVSVAEHVLFLAMLGGVNNPYTDVGNNFGFVQSYLAWRTSTIAKRMRGVPYQVPGPSQRGAAKPEVEAPPPAAE